MPDTALRVTYCETCCERRLKALPDSLPDQIGCLGGAYAHTDDGVEVRRIFHKLRSIVNEHFKSIFDVHEQDPTKGRVNTTRFALGTVFVYQLLCATAMSEGWRSTVGYPHLRSALFTSAVRHSRNVT